MGLSHELADEDISMSIYLSLNVYVMLILWQSYNNKEIGLAGSEELAQLRNIRNSRSE